MLFKISKFFLFASVFFVAIVTTSTLFPFIVGKYFWFRLCVDLALIAFLLGIVLDERAEFFKQRLVNVVKSPIFWAMGLFVLVFLLAGFFGIDPTMSFWSNFERGEGGLQMLHLLVFSGLLAVLFVERKDWNKIFALSMIAALLMISYGIAASLKYVDAEYQDQNGTMVATGEGGAFYNTFNSFIGESLNNRSARFSGSIGNPAYTAAYLIFALFYAAFLLFEKYRRHLKSFGGIAILASMALYLIFFYLAATRGALLGLMAGTLTFLAYIVYTNEKWRKQGIILGVALVFVLSMLVAFNDSAIVKKLPSSRLFDISFTAETFRHRAFMWETAWDGFKERPLLGWGPENYIHVFDRYMQTDFYVPSAGFGAWFDRAHSVVFDYLAQTGILGLLSYLSIFVVFYIEFFRKRTAEHNRLLSALVFAMPVAYLVQGIILFDVLTISFNLFLFLGFAYYFIYHSTEKTV